MNDVINSRRRGRPAAFNRDDVLMRAMEVFWARGYDLASIPLLTERMGISAQSLYAAFGSKDALYREAMELYQTTVGGFGTKALAEEKDAVSAVARLIHDAALVFSSSDYNPGCMITTAPSGDREEPLSEFGKQLRTQSIEQVRARLQRGVEDGQVKTDIDCEVWARFVAAIVHGLSVQARDGMSRDALIASADLAAASLEVLRAKVHAD